MSVEPRVQPLLLFVPLPTSQLLESAGEPAATCCQVTRQTFRKALLLGDVSCQAWEGLLLGNRNCRGREQWRMWYRGAFRGRQASVEFGDLAQGVQLLVFRGGGDSVGCWCLGSVWY